MWNFWWRAVSQECQAATTCQSKPIKQGSTNQENRPNKIGPSNQENQTNHMRLVVYRPIKKVSNLDKPNQPTITFICIRTNRKRINQSGKPDQSNKIQQSRLSRPIQKVSTNKVNRTNKTRFNQSCINQINKKRFGKSSKLDQSNNI